MKGKIMKLLVKVLCPRCHGERIIIHGNWSPKEFGGMECEVTRGPCVNCKDGYVEETIEVTELLKIGGKKYIKRNKAKPG